MCAIFILYMAGFILLLNRKWDHSAKAISFASTPPFLPLSSSPLLPRRFISSVLTCHFRFNPMNQSLATNNMWVSNTLPDMPPPSHFVLPPLPSASISFSGVGTANLACRAHNCRAVSSSHLRTNPHHSGKWHLEGRVASLFFYYADSDTHRVHLWKNIQLKQLG